MRALLRKEWREHRWVLLAMLLVLGAGQFATLMSVGTMGSPMVAYQKPVAVFGPLMALILVNRLVVREHMGRTQLFLEPCRQPDPGDCAEMAARRCCSWRWPPASAPPYWPRADRWC